MDIVQSNIQMYSERQFMAAYSREESLQVFNARGGEAESGSQVGNGRIQDTVELSGQAESGQSVGVVEGSKSELAKQNDPQLEALIKFIEQVTGKKVKLMDPSQFTRAKASQQEDQVETKAVNNNRSGGIGFEYNFRESYQESEKTSVKTEGVIKTADGKEIDFDLEVHMSRKFLQSQAVHIQAGEKIDPLVVNFQGNSAQVTQDKFEFDLDMDGQVEEMSFPGQGSGFLAMDKDGNGAIDDGSELFGPSTGDGFAELAGYDQDQDGWIDEADSVFSDLKIWSKGPEGQDKLVSIGKAGIGAIYLGSIESAFGIKDEGNQTQAQVTETGMYVSEQGQVGSIQEMDFVV